MNFLDQERKIANFYRALRNQSLSDFLVSEEYISDDSVLPRDVNLRFWHEIGFFDLTVPFEVLIKVELYLFVAKQSDEYSSLVITFSYFVELLANEVLFDHQRLPLYQELPLGDEFLEASLVFEMYKTESFPYLGGDSSASDSTGLLADDFEQSILIESELVKVSCDESNMFCVFLVHFDKIYLVTSFDVYIFILKNGRFS